MSETRISDALIVAGGAGTRLRPLTDHLPKPLLPFCGEPFLVGVIRRLAAAGIERVHLVIGADAAPFDVLRPSAADAGVTLEVVPEPEPLDTAGGVRSVAARFDRPVLVLNGDILTDVDYRAVASAHVEAGVDVTIVLVEVEDTSSFGVAVRDGTRVVAFVEKPPPGTLPDQRGVNAGTYVLDPRVFDRYPPGRLSFERVVFPELLEHGGSILGVPWGGVWADLGTPERYRDGHRMALDGALAWPSVDEVPADGGGRRVAATATVAPAATLHGPCLVLPGATVATGAVVGPYAILGRDAHVGAGAEVAGAILHDGVHIGSGVVARDLIAGRGAVIEPGARLDDAIVPAGAHIVAETH